MTTTAKLTRLIEAHGVQVERIVPVRGFWKAQDVYRWECFGTHNGISFYAGCWDTMTECLKHGITLDYSEVYRYQFNAKAPG